MNKNDYLLLAQLLSSQQEATAVHMKQLVMLHISIGKISEIQDYQDIPRVFVNEVIKIFSATACSLRLFDKEQRTLTLLAESGSENGGVISGDSTLSLDDFPIFNSILIENTVKQIIISDQNIQAEEYELLDRHEAKTTSHGIKDDASSRIATSG